MKHVNKGIFFKGKFSSSLWFHIKQIKNSDTTKSQYANEIMERGFDLFVNQKKINHQIRWDVPT